MSFICYDKDDVHKLRDLLTQSYDAYNIKLDEKVDEVLKLYYKYDVETSKSKSHRFWKWIGWFWTRERIIDLFNTKPDYLVVGTFEEYVKEHRESYRRNRAGSSLRFYKTMFDLVDAAERDRCDIKLSKKHYDTLIYGLENKDVYSIDSDY